MQFDNNLDFISNSELQYQQENISQVHSDVLHRLIKVDNEVMEEVKQFDIDICVTEIDDLINSQFKDYLNVKNNNVNNVVSYFSLSRFSGVNRSELNGVGGRRNYSTKSLNSKDFEMFFNNDKGVKILLKIVMV